MSSGKRFNPIEDVNPDEQAEEFYSMACCAGDCGWCFNSADCMCECHAAYQRRMRKRRDRETYDG